MLRRFLIVGLLLCSGESALAAPSVTFIFEGQKLAYNSADLESSALRGTKVWLGVRNGDAGTAKIINGGSDEDGVILNEEFDAAFLLGYNAEGEFLTLQAAPIDDRTLMSLIVAEVKKKPGATSLHLFKEAEVDLDNDGKMEQVIKANSLRASADPYRGNSTAIEGLFIVGQRGGNYQVIDRILAEEGDEIGPRNNIDLLAIGRADSSSPWDILVKSESRQSGKGDSDIAFTINGEALTDIVTCNNSLEVKLLALKEAKLVTSTFFSKSSSGFGTYCE